MDLIHSTYLLDEISIINLIAYQVLYMIKQLIYAYVIFMLWGCFFILVILICILYREAYIKIMELLFGKEIEPVTIAADTI
jgi:hypothetical protein